MTTDHDLVRSRVLAGYSEVAKSGGCCDAGGGVFKAGRGGSCCGPTLGSSELAERIGYSRAELEALPGGANLGLSCGNPGAIAALKAGEVVLDLGSGAGFDVFLCGPKVGANGRVIGVDMTPDMLAKARGNIAAYTARTGFVNVEFRMGEIEHLPVADASIDVVISNCVINLSPNKPQVWREIFRVLKPGGRVAVSDMVLLKPLPDAVREQVEAYVGCIAGASLVEDLRAMLTTAGFISLTLTPKADYVATLSANDDPLYRDMTSKLPADSTPADYITSMNIAASKPGACCAPGCC